MSAPNDHSRLVQAAAIAVVVALAALIGGIGADARWLAALGHTILARGALPAGVPFAAAPTRQWPNTLVLAELAFSALVHAGGARALMLAQLAAAAAALLVVCQDARAGGARAGTSATALLLAGVGVLPSLAIARVQMFSLVLFPVLIWLLRVQYREPSPALWLVVLLLALWSNLHGGALLGLAVVVVYLALALAPRRPLLAAAVAVSSAAALCATPALLRTAAYYHGVLTNLAAQRGEGMWGALSLNSPVDLFLAACGLVLVVRFLRARPARWEIAVAVVLAAMTVKAQRNGVWLLLFLAPVAARDGLARPGRWRTLAAPALTVALIGLVIAIVRGPLSEPANGAAISRAIALARGGAVLAEPEMDEQVALAGGRIAVGEPIDAFPRASQAAYLDFVNGAPAGRAALRSPVRVVLVQRGSPAAALVARTPGFRRAGGDSDIAIYARTAS